MVVAELRWWCSSSWGDSSGREWAWKLHKGRDITETTSILDELHRE